MTAMAQPTARWTGLFRRATSGNRPVGLYTTRNAVHSVARQRRHENKEKLAHLIYTGAIWKLLCKGSNHWRRAHLAIMDYIGGAAHHCGP